MIVVQAGLVDGRLLLWGEAAGDSTAASPKRGRKPHKARSQPLPFAAPADALADALDPARPSLARSLGKPVDVWAWLPTVGDRPVASCPLVAEPPPVDAEAVLTPWGVTALPLTPIFQTTPFVLTTAMFSRSPFPFAR